MDEFRRKILKINGPRKHKINNSFGVYNAYKLIRKNKWFNIGKPISEHDFYKIVRTVNNKLADLLSKGHDINLPCQMGRLEIRKYDARITLQGDKVVTNLPIDWDRTLKLWSEDEEAYQKRTLIKMEEKEIFSIHYNRAKAKYENKSFFGFQPNRQLKLTIKRNIKAKKLDTFSYDRRNNI